MDTQVPVPSWSPSKEADTSWTHFFDTFISICLFILFIHQKQSSTGEACLLSLAFDVYDSWNFPDCIRVNFYLEFDILLSEFTNSMY